MNEENIDLSEIPEVTEEQMKRATLRVRGEVLLGKGESEEMTDEQLLERISIDPRVMVGKPVIKGTRLTVEYILRMLAHGVTIGEILDEYEGLVPEDIQACLLFATKSLESAAFVPLVAETV